MKEYRYKAYDREGKIKKGRCRAKDKRELSKILRRERLRLKEATEISKKFKISKSEILSFTKEIVIMLESGITIIKIFEIQEQQYSKYFKNILSDIKEDLLSGDTLGEAFGKNEKVFGDFYVGMVSLGEISGNLVENLKKICEHLELEIGMMKRIKEVVFYPVIILIFSSIIITFLMVYIFPNFIKIFEDSKVELPFITRILIEISNKFYIILILLMCILIIIIFVLKEIKKNRVLKERFDRFILKVPIVKKFIVGNYIIKFSKNLAIMLSSGMLIMDILKLLRNFFKNTIIKREIEKLEKDLFEGKQLSESIVKNNLFLNKYIKLIVVGEKSGELVKIFDQITKLEEEKIENDIKKMLVLAEPLLIIILGLILSIIIIAIYLPIFNMSNLIE